MVAVQRTARGGTQFPRIDLDLSAFVGKNAGSKVFDLPNLADAENVPGQLYIIAMSDGFASPEAQAAAGVKAVMEFFPDLGRFMARLSLPDWIDILGAWTAASKEAMTVDPKASSSSTSS